MDREILFIAKRKDNGKWIEGDYCKIPNPNIVFYNKDNEVDAVEVIPETVGQYTGMSIDGVKTFEGDILGGKYFKGVVKFIGGQWFVIDGNSGFVTLNYAITEDYYIKVIGNIHDK